MQNDLKLWKRLYELSARLNEMKPWIHMYSNDFVCIEMEEEHYVYCSIMGKMGDCIGISMYEGIQGYADLCSISHEYPDDEISKYIMFDQTCMTWYMGDREEVPSEQKKIIKELGLRFRGRGNWPYIISFEPKYYPWTPDNKQIERACDILERLIEVLSKYIENQIDVDFERDEMIFAHLENKQWVYESMSLPDELDKYLPVILEDKNIYDELNQQERVHEEIYLELSYLNTFIKDKKFKRPANALVFLAVDKKTEQIIGTHLFEPDEDEIDVVLTFFIEYIFKIGKPKNVYVRNPKVYCAIQRICDYCDIDFSMDNFDIIDEIIYAMSQLR